MNPAGDPSPGGGPQAGTEADGGPSLEERLRRLEQIVGELETEELGLDQALALFEEGVRLVKEAEESLSAAELRVEELLGEGAELRTRPLDEGEG